MNILLGETLFFVQKEGRGPYGLLLTEPRL